ncbi:hypothetical protein [uncultured Celeribacter sp.]|uniref:hypothetical protein n=1 Tax=uncultured Celeribacter sp. TaxID=1303376 RepID=UPI002AA82D36|nr:hypothetical protein [uncultured Celeribacter sp.]
MFWDVSSLFDAERHVQDKAAILAALRISPGGPTVVMNHHLPLRELIAPWRLIGGHEKRAMNNPLPATFGTRSRVSTSTHGYGGTATRASAKRSKATTARSASSRASGDIRRRGLSSIRLLYWISHLISELTDRKKSRATLSLSAKNPFCSSNFAGKHPLNCGAATVADRKIKGRTGDRGTEEKA